MKQSTLVILVGAQLLLVALVYGLQTGGGAEPEPFLNFDVDVVDTLSVADAEQALTVTRTDDAWTVAGGLPADSGKIDRVLGKLAEAEGGWPVATSDSAMTRFEVTEEAHQRHVTVGGGDATLADIYLGTSPSYQRVHARHASGGPVYAIDFSNYEAGAKVSDWLRKSLLQPEGTLQSVARVGEAGWILESTDDGWSAAGAMIDQDEAAEYTARFTGLNVLGLVDAELPEEPTARFVLTDDAGDSRAGPVPPRGGRRLRRHLQPVRGQVRDCEIRCRAAGRVPGGSCARTGGRRRVRRRRVRGERRRRRRVVAPAGRSKSWLVRDRRRRSSSAPPAAGRCSG